MLFQATALLAAPPAPADKIKAAYIYQLTHFITWPDAATATKDFPICILGKEPITQELAPLDQRQQGKRFIKVLHPKTIHDAADCRILYIAKSNQHQLQTILRYLHHDLRDNPILTVSSLSNFAANGGIIGFVIINNKVRLEINPACARRANIKLNAKLLEVANIVGSVATNNMPGETCR